jgi:hypothetical protein
MARSALVAHTAWSMAVLVAIAACDGKVIRLGRARALADAGDAAVAADGEDVPAGADAADVALGADGKDAILGVDEGAIDSESGSVCVKGQVKANEVGWIGDSWVTIPGSQYTTVQDYARAARAIGPNEEYRVAAAAAASMAAITEQYRSLQSGATKLKVVIMNGGTWETTWAGINGGDVNAAVAVEASDFELFLDQVERDGTVEHIVYFLNPELPTIYGVPALRPLVQQACTDLTNRNKVACHFLDLQPIWAEHPEYTDPVSKIQASDAGGRAIADAIWKIMQDNCIAQ